MEVVSQLSDIVRDCGLKEDPHKFHALIVEDYDNFIFVLNQALLHNSFTYAIVITSLMKYKEVSSKVFCL